MRAPTSESPRPAGIIATEVLDALTSNIAVLDGRGVVIAVNDAWRRFAAENDGDGATAYLGVNYLAVCEEASKRGPDRVTSTAALDGIRAVLRGEVDSFSLEYPCHSPTQERWFSLQVTRSRGEGRSDLVVAHEEITARKRAESQLEDAKLALEAANCELESALLREQVLARTDGLTGLLNRRHFFDLAAHEFAVARRYGRPLSIILFDIDHFKEANDEMGHLVGDEILKGVAQVAATHRREADILARYGGEEFVMLVPNPLSQAALVAERVRKDVAEPGIDTSHGRARVTVSAGVAEADAREESVVAVIRRADEALYAAKRAGRNRTEIWSEALL